VSEKYKAKTGLSYKSGGEWKVAAKGDVVELEDDVAKDALARGAVKPITSQTKTKAVKA
jgi:hypothetical protein